MVSDCTAPGSRISGSLIAVAFDDLSLFWDEIPARRLLRPRRQGFSSGDSYQKQFQFSHRVLVRPIRRPRKLFSSRDLKDLAGFSAKLNFFLTQAKAPDDNRGDLRSDHLTIAFS
jgi:hypothetical protein